MIKNVNNIIANYPEIYIFIIKADHLDHMDHLDHLDNLDHLDHLDHLDNLDHLDHLDHMENLDHLVYQITALFSTFLLSPSVCHRCDISAFLDNLMV